MAIANINDLEKLVGSRSLRLIFPKPIEAEFEFETQSGRCSQLARSAYIGLIVYLLLLYADFMLLRDVFFTAIGVRFSVVFAVLLLVFYCLRQPSPFRREASQSAGSIIVAISIACLAVMSHSPGRIFYHFGLVEVVMFANIVQRLRFKFALFVTSSIYIMHLIVVLSMPEIKIDHALAANSLIFASCVFVLAASYASEKWERKNFILSNIDKLRVEQLDRQAMYDGLTNLRNRNSLNSYMKTAPTGYLEVALIDIDFFKKYNDKYGHLAGDACLQAVANIISEYSATAELVARYGGEEFIMIFRQRPLDPNKNLIEGMRRKVCSLGIPHTGRDFPQIVTISVGFAGGQILNQAEFVNLVGQADEALYSAKHDGRNRVAYYNKMETQRLAVAV